MGLSVDIGLPAGLGPFPHSLKSEPPGWVFADGRTLLANTPYQALRNAYIADGFPHGQDGSGNPKIPDMRGRHPVGKDDMGGTAANRLTAAGSGVAGNTLGAVGGSQSITLDGNTIPPHAHQFQTWSPWFGEGEVPSPKNAVQDRGSGSAWGGPGNVVVSSTGGGGAHNNMSPCLVCNYIVKA